MLGNEFWIQLIIYAISLGSFGGIIVTRINYLEQKIDRYNGIKDRITMLEQSVKSAHHRLDELKEDIK